MKSPSTSRLKLACLASAAMFALNVTASAQSFLLDFGGTANQMDFGDDPSFTWNNVTTTIATNSAGSLFDLLTTNNEFSDMDLFMIARFNGVNDNGTLASLLYPTDATRDSLYGNTEAFNNLSNIFPEFKLTSLDPAKTYDITFYASRLGVTDNRTTEYTVTGAASGSVLLNVANNVDNQVTLFGVAPSALGEIAIRLTPGAANNNANHFTYLGVLRIDAIPEPSSALMLIGGATLLGLKRRRTV